MENNFQDQKPPNGTGSLNLGAGAILLEISPKKLIFARLAQNGRAQLGYIEVRAAIKNQSRKEVLNLLSCSRILEVKLKTSFLLWVLAQSLSFLG